MLSFDKNLALHQHVLTAARCHAGSANTPMTARRRGPDQKTRHASSPPPTKQPSTRPYTAFAASQHEPDIRRTGSEPIHGRPAPAKQTKPACRPEVYNGAGRCNRRTQEGKANADAIPFALKASIILIPGTTGNYTTGRCVHPWIQCP